MKKLFYLFIAASMTTACSGYSTEATKVTDSVAVDSAAVDSVAIDSVVLDSVAIDSVAIDSVA